MDTRIADILPPKIPPLYTPMRKGMPTKGWRKKEMGNKIAMAIVVVNPGSAPTSIPNIRPRPIMPKVSHRRQS
jgi:hypothetical protein